MTDEEFTEEIQELVGMFRALRLIRDRSRTKWLKREIRESVIRILKDS